MRTSLAAAVSIFSIIMWPAMADARPKGVKFTCSAAQVQSPEAAACLAQMEQDISSGKPTLRGLYCSSTGKMLCCQYDTSGSIVDHSCSVVSRASSKAPHGVLKKAPAATKK